MKFFAHTRFKRHTALVVLLVWVFALASGVANACLLQTPELHSKVPAQSAHHPGASSGHHDDADNSKESCLKVCDDGTHSLVKTPLDVDHTDPGRAPLVTVLWTGSPPEISAPRRLDDLAIPIAGPPFRVRYSRLAL